MRLINLACWFEIPNDGLDTQPVGINYLHLRFGTGQLTMENPSRRKQRHQYEVRTMPSLPRPIRAFISYRRDNGGIAFACLLHERLTSIGISCFYDVRSMEHFSDDFSENIHDSLISSDYVIVLLQPGCLEERSYQTDYFIEELRLAKRTGKEMICLPISPEFNWEVENPPQDLDYMRLLNLAPTLTIAGIDETVKDIVSRFTDTARSRHPLMLHVVSQAAFKENSHSVIQRLSDITSIHIEERWHNAKRISLLAIGCQGIISRFFSDVRKRYEEGTQFRFISVDPNSGAADDILNSKLNSARYGREENYLVESVASAVASLREIGKSATLGGRIEYRLARFAPTCTIQIVEHENPADDYAFIELLPLYGINTTQDSNMAALIPSDDAAYNYFVRQFEECWQQSSTAYSSTTVVDQSCEFCQLNEEGNEYILYNSGFWTVYLADNQNYPGRCIIPLNRHAANLSELTEEEWRDLREIVRATESALTEALNPTNFNWTCLMNGGYASEPYNPHVHFHLIPRYAKPVSYEGETFSDALFGSHYTLSTSYQLADDARHSLTQALRNRLNKA